MRENAVQLETPARVFNVEYRKAPLILALFSGRPGVARLVWAVLDITVTSN